jgi:hypothetical protein
VAGFFREAHISALIRGSELRREPLAHSFKIRDRQDSVTQDVFGVEGAGETMLNRFGEFSGTSYFDVIIL